MADDSTARSTVRSSVLAGTCGSCGSPLGSGELTRAAVPQPMAAALSLARALTPRERAVFQFLGFGYDNRSVARELEISERTVKRYVTAILAKLKLESRLQAGLTALVISATADGFWPEGRVEWQEAPGRH